MELQHPLTCSSEKLNGSFSASLRESNMSNMSNLKPAVYFFASWDYCKEQQHWSHIYGAVTESQTGYPANTNHERYTLQRSIWRLSCGM